MNAIPEYGIVTWKDATSYTGRKLPAKSSSRWARLPTVVSIGRLSIGAGGMLTILHEFPQEPGYHRDLEATMIPMGWYTEIIPLLPPTVTPKKVEGIDSGHVNDSPPRN